MRRSLIAAVVCVAVAVVGAVPAAASDHPGVPSEMSDAQRQALGRKLHPGEPDVPLIPSTPVTAGTNVQGPLKNTVPAKVTWPAAGSTHLHATAGHDTAAGSVGDLKLSAHRRDKSAEQNTVDADVTVLSRAEAQAAGVDGILLKVSAGDAPLDLSVGYQSLAAAGGGDWASRLHLVQMPACSLTNPAKSTCRTQTPIASTNDAKSSTVTAQLMSAPATVMALTAGVSGGAGNWSATPLAPSSAWQVNNQSGDFTWSYPLTTPPTQNGPSPSLALTYDAGSLDGKIASTNNQTSWIGDGWDMDSGYVERKYVSCADDATGNANNVGHPTGDLCWRSDNATLVLAGHSSELIKDATTSTWRLKQDDGTRVEHLTGSWNGDNDTEYWKVTTPDGTQYWFGRDKRSATDTLSLNSAWTVPVYGNNPGDPCYAATFAASSCTQAWRWNLDYVVDPSGNSMTYAYAKETNNYGANNNTTVASYVRGGYLTRIDYGQRQGAENSAPAPQQVNFTVAERCLPSGSITCDPAQLTSTTASSWPDVPYDLICTSSSSCPSPTSPAFFTRKRLTTVSTAVYTGGAYQGVDSWTLTHKFPSPGDGSNAVLWLDSIKHTGTAPGSALTLPAVTFSGLQLTNRVDTSGNLGPSMTRWRVSSIVSETGAITTINYTPADCTTTDLPASADSNSRLCFPVVWNPEGSGGPVTEYFHKYLVSSVFQDSLDNLSLPVETHYTYVGTPAWHYDDSPLTPNTQRTWNQFRGYDTVDVYTGASTTTQLHTRARYFRGMNGDHLAAGGTKSVSIDGIADVDRANGFAREQITYDGSAVVTDTKSTPWISAATATDADGRSATFLGNGTTDTATTAAQLPGGLQTARTLTTYDTASGLPTQIDDLGDTSTASDDRCTRLTYAQNPSLNILSTVARVETVNVQCSATPNRPTNVISDSRTLYDALAFGAAPTQGLATSVQELTGYTGGTPTYATTSSTVYDANGRPTATSDALSRTTTTAYTPATGGPVIGTTITTPDPDGTGPGTALVSSSTLDPARGVPLTATDPNGKVTTATYDGLGRRIAVWLPGRSAGSSASMTYAYTVGAGGVSTVTTNTLGQDGTYLTSVEIDDALGRLRQTQSMGQNRDVTARLITGTTYDSRGLATIATDAWATTGSPSTTPVQPSAAVPSRTLYTYDGAGRTTVAAYQVDQAPKWQTTATYQGDRLTVVPPAGGTPTATISDARGNTVELRQYTTSSTTGPYQSTTYSYDSAGRLTTTHDAAGSLWSNNYDQLGRLTTSVDPDKGTTTNTYDAADQLITTTDARATTLWFGYDQLGRKIAERNGSATGTLASAWTYDTLAKGQLTSSTRYSAGNGYTTAVTGYDNAYQPLGQSVTLPAAEGTLAGTYTAGYTYTLDEQVKTQALGTLANLPAETVTTNYDKLSLPSWTTGGLGKGAYVVSTQYSSLGDLSSMDLGNSYSDYVTYTYEEGTRRLSTLALSRQNVTGDDVHQTYAYDDAGNVISIADTPTVAGAQNDTQCFGYDGLRRLTQAWTPATGGCAQTPTTAGMGGPAPYWTNYGYDTAGDRTSVTNHAAAGNTTATYTYPAATAAHPHAVNQVATTGPGVATTSSYGYDQDGNTTSRPGTGTNQTLTWDDEGHLATVTTASGTTSYLYGADGQRLLRRQGTTVTAYLPGGQELTLNTSTSVLSAVRYYSFNGQTIAVRTAAGFAGVTSLVPDPHNSAVAAITNSTNAITTRRLDPFGNVRGTASTWPTDRAFLGDVVDASGLTQIGARAYDATIGRFISVDPVFQLNDPLQWNGYAYSASNPVTWSDPTGLSLWTSIKHAASSAKNWANTHKAAIAGFAVGFIAGAACTALTGGSLALVCGAIGGALAGAVTNLWKSKIEHTQQFSWASLASDIAIGAAAGAVGGQLGKLATRAVAAVAARAGPVLGKAVSAVAGKVAPAIRPAANRAGSTVAQDVAGTSAGGAARVAQGAAGVQRTVADLEAAGGKVLGREVSVDVNGVRTRPDLFAEFPNGQRGFLEVKTGPGARLTANQATGFPGIRAGGAVPVGDNAAAAGLPPGVPLGPTPVWTIYQPWPLG